LGINVNLAPVCDITTDSEQFMYLRSFSENADEVSEFASRTVSIYKEKKLGSTLKHFPGYGDNVDTHTGIARDTRSYSEFLSKDFKPFEAGVKAGADCVLVSHNIMECIDDEQPASLSDKVHQTLRDTLQFKGVIVTDDLIMEAITDYTGADTAAVAAVKAGNDMLCCSDLENQYPAVVEAVRNQEIPMPQIDRSVRRVLQWKQSLNLI
ncbi:MAG: beta-hexosaminidase, partial [Ruminococcus sp.]|nr:beta-hexosaminidase [Ruminococcus sp.]